MPNLSRSAFFFYKIRFNKLRTAQFEPEIMRVIPCGLDTDVVFREKLSFYRTQVRMMHINSTIYMSEVALPFDTRRDLLGQPSSSAWFSYLRATMDSERLPFLVLLLTFTMVWKISVLGKLSQIIFSYFKPTPTAFNTFMPHRLFPWMWKITGPAWLSPKMREKKAKMTKKGPPSLTSMWSTSTKARVIQYTVGRPVIRKVLKRRIWGVPPACLGSR